MSFLIERVGQIGAKYSNDINIVTIFQPNSELNYSLCHMIRMSLGTAIYFYGK